MPRLLLLTVAFLLSLPTVQAQRRAVNPPRVKPRAVVGIVVDQMRWDYLHRFQDRFGNGGFRRLMNRGFSCDQHFINYLPSFTAPGHASIYTGSTPAIHGIAGNEWIDQSTGKFTYCTEDNSVQTVGATSKAGLMSPRNMLTSTVGDELRLATNNRSRVFAISLKDRASILPGGHLANAAYWLDNSGAFITSTYYRKALPQWLQNFNNRKVPDSLLRLDWNTLYPIQTYVQSTPDSTPYEGTLKGGTVTFPHLTAQYAGSNIGNIRSLPAGNDLITMLAQEIIRQENIGQGSFTDMLAISFSATDYVGHQYGPNSIEVEDTYLRLDQNLATLLRAFDAAWGKDNYIVFLTADHGGAHNSSFLSDRGIPAGIIRDPASTDALNALLGSKPTGRVGAAAVPKPVRLIENYQIYLDSNANTDAIRAVVVRWLQAQPWNAWTWDPLAGMPLDIPEPIRTMVINGYNKGRSGAVQFIPKPAWYSGYGPTGTTHGAWNPYDTHIPMLWYGWGVQPGRTLRRTHMTDVAPTLAALLNIQMPNGCIGAPIREIAE